MIWHCYICYIFVAVTLKKPLSQINSLHSLSPDFRVVCGIDGCPSEYRVYNSYYYHIKRTHVHQLLQVDRGEEQGSMWHTSLETCESTTKSNQTNISCVAEDQATQQHSSETEEASSIVTQTVSIHLCCFREANITFYCGDRYKCQCFTCFNREYVSMWISRRTSCQCWLFKICNCISSSVQRNPSTYTGRF